MSAYGETGLPTVRPTLAYDETGYIPCLPTVRPGASNTVLTHRPGSLPGLSVVHTLLGSTGYNIYIYESLYFIKKVVLHVMFGTTETMVAQCSNLQF